MTNEKHQKRIEETREKFRIEEKERGERGKGTLRFESACTKWTKSEEFKAIHVSERNYQAQWDLIRALKNFLTEEERKEKYLYEIEDRLLNFFNHELPKQRNVLYSTNDVYKNSREACGYALVCTFERFVDYVNRLQNKYDQVEILLELKNRIWQIKHRMTESHSLEELAPDGMK